MDESGKKHVIEVPDHVEILCDLNSGGVARLCFSAVAGLGPKNECWIFGTNATLRVDFAGQRIFGGGRGDADLADLTPPESSYKGWRVEEEFISAIRGQEKIKFTTFEDGVKYMEFTDAVTTSSMTGQAVELPMTIHCRMARISTLVESGRS
jgi:predicted dehydrogenase